MAAEVHKRRYARERAIELLYEAEQKNLGIDEVLAALPLAPDDYAIELVRGSEQHRVEFDAMIEQRAKGWTLARMPLMDKVILRLGIEELTAQPDVPTAVIINEAVELAKQYSTDDSPKFVNGLLARVADDIR